MHRLIARRLFTVGTLVALALPGVSLLLLAVSCEAQDAAAPPSTAAELVARVDEAARSLDYEAALSTIALALPGADEATAAALKVRDAVYRRYLETPELLATARDNPDRLVGVVKTRGGQTLSGLLQLFELGIIPDAGLGNRRPGEGGFALLLADGTTRTIATPQLAAAEVEWAAPVADGWPSYWHISGVTVTLHNGEVVTGKPGWVLPLSSIAVRPAGAEDDTLITSFTVFGGEVKTGDLAAGLLLVGAPPLPTPPTETTERIEP